MAAALIELGNQLDVSIIFDKRIAEDMICHDLAGKLSASEAFTLRLADTALEFELLQGQIYSIRRQQPDPPVEPALPPIPALGSMTLP